MRARMDRRAWPNAFEPARQERSAPCLVPASRRSSAPPPRVSAESHSIAGSGFPSDCTPSGLCFLRTLRFAGAVQRNGRANERGERGFIDFLAFRNVDGATHISIEARV